MSEKTKELNEFVKGELCKDISCKSELLMELCETHEFNNAFQAAKILCGGNLGELVKLTYKIVELYPCDRSLIAFCNILLDVIKEIILFVRYRDADEMVEKLQNIVDESHHYSNEALYYFAQTLEMLFACGYKCVGYTIFLLYQRIDADCIYQPTTLTVSKQMSCVYVIGDDNYHEVTKRCKKVKRLMDKGNMEHLRGICYYYLGLLEAYDFRLIDADEKIEDCYLMTSNGYMERSKDLEFQMAKQYIKHHST